MYCPCVHAAKPRPNLNFHVWSNEANGLVSSELVAKYQALAESVLNFLCSCCHKKGTLLVKPNLQQSCNNEALSVVNAALNSATASMMDLRTLFEQRMNLYCAGRITPDIFYKEIIDELISDFTTKADDKAWEIFKNVLSLIEDPERRCNLQLRYYRSRPRVWTRCCNTEHCFKCNTKGYHEGKSCELNMSVLDSSINSCPSCGVAIVKGDGCNSVNCVCGRQFSWSEELVITKNTNLFLQQYPYHTSYACARLLCGDVLPQRPVEAINSSNNNLFANIEGLVGVDGGDNDRATESSIAISTSHTPSSSQLQSILRLAQAWRSRNRSDVDRGLVRWWGDTFQPYPSQVCALLQSQQIPDENNIVIRYDPISFVQIVKSNHNYDASPYPPQCEGIKEAQRLWLASHHHEVNIATEHNNAAMKSLFKTFFTTEESQIIAAVYHDNVGWFDVGYASRCPQDTARYITSLRSWQRENMTPESVSRVQTDIETKRAQQFVSLYGHRTIPFANLLQLIDVFVPKFEQTNVNSPLQVSANKRTIFVPHAATGIVYPAQVRLSSTGIHRLEFVLSRLPETLATEASAGHSNNNKHLLLVELTHQLDVYRIFMYNAVPGQKISVTVNSREMSIEAEWVASDAIHSKQKSSGRLRSPISQRIDATKQLALQIRCSYGFQVCCVPTSSESELLQIYNKEHLEMFLNYKTRLRKLANKDCSCIDMAKLSNLARKWNKSYQGNVQLCTDNYMKLLPFIDKFLLAVPKEKPAPRQTSSGAAKVTNSKSCKVIQAMQPLQRQPVVVATTTEGLINMSSSESCYPAITYQSFVHAVCWGRLHYKKSSLTVPASSSSKTKTPVEVVSPSKHIPGSNTKTMKGNIPKSVHGAAQIAVQARVSHQRTLRTVSQQLRSIHDNNTTTTAAAAVIELRATAEVIEGNVSIQTEMPRINRSSRESVLTAMTASRRASLYTSTTDHNHNGSFLLPRAGSNRSLQSLSASSATSSSMQSMRSAASSTNTQTSSVRSTRSSCVRESHTRRSSLMKQQARLKVRQGDEGLQQQWTY